MRLAKASFAVLLIFGLAIALALPASAADEYFTEAELNLIRDAQGLALRVPVYFKLAERRLIFLGVMEKSEKEKEKERKEREKREKEAKKGGPAAQTPVDELAYLDEFTPPELLRGYIQALDEVMSNIDDAYSRRLDVRDSLEDLEKFTRETIPLLQKFKPRNAGERSALEDAVDRAKQAQAETKEALKTVPKTERKRTVQ